MPVVTSTSQSILAADGIEETIAVACYGAQKQLLLTQQHLARALSPLRSRAIVDWTARQTCVNDLVRHQRQFEAENSVLLLDECADDLECIDIVARRYNASVLVNASAVRTANDHLCCDYLCIVNGSRAPTSWLQRLYRRFVRSRSIPLDEWLQTVTSHRCVLLDMWLPQLYVLRDEIRDADDAGQGHGSAFARTRSAPHCVSHAAPKEPSHAADRHSTSFNRFSRVRTTSRSSASAEWRTWTVEQTVGEKSGALDDPCSICLSQFERGDSKSRLRCAHCFHTACLAAFVDARPTYDDLRCPMCNQGLTDGRDLRKIKTL